MSGLDASTQRRIEVSLDIMSHSINLQTLELSLGLNGDSGSRSIGEVSVGGRVASLSILRVNSNLELSADVAQQVMAIYTRISPNSIRVAELSVSLRFNIAVYFATACGTAVIDALSVSMIHEYRAAISVTAYPTADELSAPEVS
jgi:hypothetical protein